MLEYWCKVTGQTVSWPRLFPVTLPHVSADRASWPKCVNDSSSGEYPIAERGWLGHFISCAEITALFNGWLKEATYVSPLS